LEAHISHRYTSTSTLGNGEFAVYLDYRDQGCVTGMWLSDEKSAKPALKNLKVRS